VAVVASQAKPSSISSSTTQFTWDSDRLRELHDGQFEHPFTAGPVPHSTDPMRRFKRVVVEIKTRTTDSRKMKFRETREQTAPTPQGPWTDQKIVIHEGGLQ
jgi:hypothetical protein